MTNFTDVKGKKRLFYEQNGLNTNNRKTIKTKQR